jgi:hypothetical protein
MKKARVPEVKFKIELSESELMLIAEVFSIAITRGETGEIYEDLFDKILKRIGGKI